MPLIVLEGPEGAGKTTQIRLLREWLEARGTPAVAFREPGGTPVGDEIRKLLLDQPSSDMVARAETLLFMASRAQLVEREIAPALKQDAMVLLDRFFLSTYAYQVHGRGLPHEEVVAANQLATAGLRPDLTVLLSLPTGEGFARLAAREQRMSGSVPGGDRIERAGSEFHQRVARAFAEFATRDWQAAHPEAGAVVTVDALGSEKDVFARVLAALSRRWPEYSS